MKKTNVVAEPTVRIFLPLVEETGTEVTVDQTENQREVRLLCLRHDISKAHGQARKQHTDRVIDRKHTGAALHTALAQTHDDGDHRAAGNGKKQIKHVILLCHTDVVGKILCSL